MVLTRRLGLKALVAWPLTTRAEPAEPTAAPGQLSWVAGDLPPFASNPAGGPQGFAHELAQLMAKRLGRPGGVAYYPWARAVRLAESGQSYGIFPLTRTQEREARFRWLVPLMTVRQVFVGRPSSGARDLAQLRRLRVGVLRGSPLIKTLQAERFEHIVEAKDYRELLRLLQLETIQAIYAGLPMLEASIPAHGFEREPFQVLLSLGEAPLYMAASLGVSEEEAALWQRAFRELEADGSVAKLRQRYFR